MRNRYYGTILAVLLVPTFLLSAEPTIEGPESIEEGRLIRLTVKDLPENASVNWDTETLDFEGWDEGKFIGTGKVGKHRVRGVVFWIEGKKVKTKSLSKYVTIDPIKVKPVPPTPPVPPGPNPPGPSPVPPGPGPNPEPTPEPVADAWFMVIEDMENRASYPNILSVFGSGFWNGMNVGNRWRVFDYRNDDAKAHNLIHATQKPPYILAMKPNGRVIDIKALTENTTLDDVRTWVGKITGKSQISKNLAGDVFPSSLIQPTYVMRNGRLMYCPNGVCPP